jgi:hypothetical protein
MNPRRLLSLLAPLFATVAAVVMATGGGVNLLWLLLLPPLAWRTFRMFNPAKPGRAPQRFSEPGSNRVVLQLPGPNAVMVIREIRRTTGLGLLEAKQLAEEAPVVVVEGLSQTSAELVADRLRAAGGKALAAPIEET